ncbi:MAG: phosphoribosylformylglycinamidine synthase I [Gammaproteobacteria bacterium RIFCSPHIGHO2_12_FULL_45_9]|nr:MAG: phosphoribosylformylglycinamidine synthase I [Gammaproteobacteria bacterium RIFCSPHIGHO2_12_FULL_45_9]
MRIGIIQFPGSNCERETMLAVKRAGMEPVEFLWNESHEKLRSLAGYIIVGGFSYEDRSRAGIIAALDPIISVLREQSEYGKPILGICNGAQILVETGLVPGIENYKVGVALTENKRIRDGKVLGTGFYNAWVHMRLAKEYQRNAFTRYLSHKEVLLVPVAHAEGRFVMDQALLLEVQTQGLNVFQYCDAKGQVVDAFPVNPNGSIGNIAALTNKRGNVMAMMPHPERTPNGDAIFQSMRDYITQGYLPEVDSLYYMPRRYAITAYRVEGHECIVESIITDNQAVTVQNTLCQLGLPVEVRRYVHWEVKGGEAGRIQESGVLYNPRKEQVMSPPPHVFGGGEGEGGGVKSHSFLIRAKEDMVGQQRKQLLQDHFGITGIEAIRHGILWRISAKNGNMAAIVDKIIHSHILFNPYAYDCYNY